MRVSSASIVAAVAVAQLPLAAASVANIVSNHRLASKVIDKVGDRTRVVAPPREQPQPGRDAQGQLRDARGRFTSGAGTVDLAERRAG